MVIHPFIHQSIIQWWSIHSSIHPPIYPSNGNPSIHPSSCPTIHWGSHFSIRHPSICFMYVSIHVYISPVPAPVWGHLLVWWDARQPAPLPSPSSSPPGRPSTRRPSGSSWHRCAATRPAVGSEAAAPPAGRRTRWLSLHFLFCKLSDWFQACWAMTHQAWFLLGYGTSVGSNHCRMWTCWWFMSAELHSVDTLNLPSTTVTDPHSSLPGEL